MDRRSGQGLVLVAAAAMALTACGDPPGGREAGQAVTPSAESWTEAVTPSPPDDTTAPSSSTPSKAPASDTATAMPTYRVSDTATPTPAPSATPSASSRASRAAFERPSRGGVELPPTGTGPLQGRRVVVDPGHNGVYDARINERQVPAGGGRRKACNTSGTANSAMSEHELTWDVASALAADLQSRGATVWLTRPDDRGVGPCVDERAGIGNRVGADLVVSIHADGNTSASARGFHIITSATMKGGPEAESRSQDLARLVRDEMVTTGMPISTYLGRRGIDVRADIAGVNLSEPPAVMLEMGNMRHPRDAALFADRGWRQKASAALANAVTSSIGR